MKQRDRGLTANNPYSFRGGAKIEKGPKPKDLAPISREEFEAYRRAMREQIESLERRIHLLAAALEGKPT